VSLKAFGKYRPIAELGRGGMAVVYLAASQGPRGFSKLVVVKQLKEEFSSDNEFSAMFVDEARLAARLNHPNIVQTYEVEEQGGRFFIVMEYLEGQPLSQVRTRLSKLGAPLRDQQARVLRDVLEGLHHAHELVDYDGTKLFVVHRDVSPHNVIITYGGEAKLVDFGIAKAADSTSQTRTGVIKGKLAYMAPEQAFGKPVDRRADIFSIGVILWEAITGRRMWKGNAEGAIAHRLSVGDVPKITDFVPEPPPMLKAICERALAVRADDRYPTAAAMRQDLDQYLASLAPQNKPSARDLGTITAQAFAEERTRISGLVEAQMRALRATSETASLEVPRIESVMQSLTPGPNTPVSKSGPLTAHVATTGPIRAPAPPNEGYPIRWLVIGGIALVILGAAATTAIMQPWAQTPAGPSLAPSASTPALDAH
jgi:serine/threonine-protein kinase